MIDYAIRYRSRRQSSQYLLSLQYFFDQSALYDSLIFLGSTYGDIVMIHKVVIPAAGLGTRFLPFTKAVPKEMIPLLDKPAIQYVIEEAIDSGINNFLLITGNGKEAIANHFTPAAQLTTSLKSKHNHMRLSALEEITRTTHITYINQDNPRGLGDAVLRARHAISPHEYFGVMLPDDIIVDTQPTLAQLMSLAHQEKASVMAVQEVPLSSISSYGVIAIQNQLTSHLFEINNVQEKPAEKDASSNLAIIGRYILSDKIFCALDHLSPSVLGEVQLTDGIAHMIRDGERVLAYKISGTRYDTGTPCSWVKAVIDLALHDTTYSDEIKKFILERFINLSS